MIVRHSAGTNYFVLVATSRRSTQRGRDEILLLALVDLDGAGRGAGAGGPGDGAHGSVAGDGAQPIAHERPRTHVRRLFLYPQDLVGGVAGEHCRELRCGPWVQLLDAHDRDLRAIAAGGE